MKKQTILTAEEQCPELDAIAQKIFELAVNRINAQRWGNQHESNCPYPRQCILELTIKKLEQAV